MAQMLKHTMRYGDELHILIIEEIQSRERPGNKYISQKMKDAGTTSYKELKYMANGRETWRGHFL